MSRLLLLSHLVALASAGYTEWFFSGNSSCPGLGIGCSAPSSMCAYDSVADKYYCCSGESYDICRAFAATCGGSDGSPSSSQQECTSGSASWCCLEESERCTSRTGQINVCVATQDNPIALVSDLLMNETFSSLSSASPSASTFSVDVNSLAARATATSSSQSSTATEAVTTTSATTASTASITPTATDQSDDTDTDSVSGGTIAGAVVGGIAGLATIGALIWFLWRRRASKGHYEHPSSPGAADAGKPDQFGAGSPGYSMPAPQYHIAEMEGTREINEMSGHGVRSPQEIKELPSGQDTIRELPA